MEERRSMRRRVFSVCAGMLAVLLLACAGTAAGATWVVDDDGGADFTSIQAAVDAASDGATTFVRSGMNARECECGKEAHADLWHGLVAEGKDFIIQSRNEIKPIYNEKMYRLR